MCKIARSPYADAQGVRQRQSLPVLKNPSWSGTESIPVADRLNMAYAGSAVTRGRAKGRVVATGMAPPFVVRMERFTRVVAVSVLVAATAIGILGVTKGPHPVVAGPDHNESGEMFHFRACIAAIAATVAHLAHDIKVAEGMCWSFDGRPSAPDTDSFVETLT